MPTAVCSMDSVLFTHTFTDSLPLILVESYPIMPNFRIATVAHSFTTSSSTCGSCSIQLQGEGISDSAYSFFNKLITLVVDRSAQTRAGD